MVSMQSWPWRQACMLPYPVCTRTCINLGPLTIHVTSQHYHSQHKWESVHTCDRRHVTTTIFALLCLDYLCVQWDMTGRRVRVCDERQAKARIRDMTWINTTHAHGCTLNAMDLTTARCTSAWPSHVQGCPKIQGSLKSLQKKCRRGG